MGARIAVLFLLAGCVGDAADLPDAPDPLVAQSCGGDTCTPVEACITDWLQSCVVLTHPAPGCIPCAPGADAYHCPYSACLALPGDCTRCSCLPLGDGCRCDDAGHVIRVTCHQPGS